MIRLTRKRFVGSAMCFGGYQISVQELVDRDVESSGTLDRYIKYVENVLTAFTAEIGPVPLTQLPTCVNPRGSIAFRITYQATQSESTGLVNSRSQINQMQNDVSRLGYSSSALMTLRLQLV
jgi:hypothetical protein